MVVSPVAFLEMPSKLLNGTVPLFQAAVTQGLGGPIKHSIEKAIISASRRLNVSKLHVRAGSYFAF